VTVPRFDMAKAPCAWQPDMWDGPVGAQSWADDERARILDAVRLCNNACPVRAECAAARDATPAKNRDGVIAGQVWHDGGRLPQLETPAVVTPEPVKRGYRHWQPAELAQLWAPGKTRQQIADELGRSIGSVDTKRAELKESRP
jgi:hypothetical protein